MSERHSVTHIDIIEVEWASETDLTTVTREIVDQLGASGRSEQHSAGKP